MQHFYVADVVNSEAMSKQPVAPSCLSTVYCSVYSFDYYLTTSTLNSSITLIYLVPSKSNSVVVS